MRAAEIETQVEALTSLDLEALRAIWRSHFGEPPKLRSPDLLRLLLAWRLQAQHLGGLDHDTRRKLRGRRPTVPEGQQLGTGAILRRDWQGKRIEVVVQSDGFHWNGQLWPSLSAVARAATGTRWNGPRFFGLRESSV
ncbi:Protein of unknown function [Roseovarius pacificus]|uniref:DUF2924 domain-containing protein n=1 Tax=Roseovarius pacificus TaxID=337701 RepID=A0A1M6X9B2_9RHOB|nr:hypothetical protein GCM10011315_07920 [Roseovarius pacificus]SHL02375.1 Protein of unknown function [Roseovarius pacificus]